MRTSVIKVKYSFCCCYLRREKTGTIISYAYGLRTESVEITGLSFKNV